jgi:lysine biosynthesis protein LysW
MLNILCPECKEKIDLPTTIGLGQQVICAACETPLEVVWLYPLSLDTVDDQSNLQLHIKNDSPSSNLYE